MGKCLKKSIYQTVRAIVEEGVLSVGSSCSCNPRSPGQRTLVCPCALLPGVTLLVGERGLGAPNHCLTIAFQDWGWWGSEVIRMNCVGFSTEMAFVVKNF